MNCNKIIAIAVSVVLLIALPIPMQTVQAIDSDRNAVNVVVEVINEEVLVAELKAMNDSELRAIGYSPEDIVEIRNFDYFTELEKCAALDDKSLLLNGYTEDEIRELRTYVESKGLTKGNISANTMTTSLFVQSKTVTPNKRTAVFKFTWKWKRTPILKFFDTVGVVWESLEGNPFAFNPGLNNSVKLTLNKIDANQSGPATRTLWQSMSAASYCSIQSKFGMSDGTYCVIQGESTFQIESTNATGRLYIEAGYAHLVFGASSPSVSVGSGGDFGFSLTFTLKHDKQVRKQLYRDNLTLQYTYA